MCSIYVQLHPKERKINFERVDNSQVIFFYGESKSNTLSLYEYINNKMYINKP